MYVDLGACLQRHPSLGSVCILSLAFSVSTRSLQNQPTFTPTVHHCESRALQESEFSSPSLQREVAETAQPVYDEAGFWALLHSKATKQTLAARRDDTDTMSLYLVRSHSAQCCW